MRKYELTVLISPDLNEDEVRSVENELTSLIEDQKGSLIGLSTPEKRELGYVIEKKHQKAYITNIKFKLDPSVTTEFENKLKEKKEILRHILLTRENEEKFQKETRRRKKPVESSPKPSSSAKQKKVELGDIDKKIDEILSE